MATRGRFVVFEGGEASGKSTQARLLADDLGALLTREPGGTALGEQLRSLLLVPERAPIDPTAELLLMVAARAQHVAEVIEPALAAGRDVVSDRFAGSTIAYQGYGRRLDRRDVDAACRLGARGVEPDLVVLLDLDERDARARLVGHGEDRIEAAGSAFHRAVRDGFLELAGADPAHWAVFDATRSVEQLHRAIAELVARRLPLRANVST